MSLLFGVLYTACNHLTGVRPDVSVWAFAWEQRWPFVPVMIVPYWSIDALFFIAPFLCTTVDEIALLRRRIVFVIVGAALGFLLMPLRFAFPRPEVAGVFAPWFAAIRGFDLPHNLFPSLHIALRTVLAEFYVRKSAGAVRGIVRIWFSLIGVSTLLTWQHHLVDVLGGFWLGALALHLLRRDEPPPATQRNATVALLYAAGAIVCTQLARVAWPWTFICTWPAFTLAAAACAYAGVGVIYDKVDGRLSPGTRLLFAPLLAGQWLSWWWYRRRSNAWDVLAPRVWIGRVLTETEARAAVAAGVSAVLDLTREFSRPRAFGEIAYLNLPVLDLTAPDAPQLRAAVEFIEREAQRGIVFVHCKAGYSRTAAAAAVWLLAHGGARDSAGAIRRLIEVRPRIVIRPEIHAALARRG